MDSLRNICKSTITRSAKRILVPCSSLRRQDYLGALQQRIIFPCSSRYIFNEKLMSIDSDFIVQNINKPRFNSTKSQSRNSSQIQGDTRSEVKLTLLNEVKAEADEAKRIYLSLKQQNLEHNDAFKAWIQCETKLSDAYSKAIKYTARLRSKDTALKSRLLLDEMISRLGIQPMSSLYTINNHGDSSDICFDDKAISTLIDSMIFYSDGDIASNCSGKNQNENNVIISTMIPPPSKQDFNNIIHSWASSKAKRKGLYAESLLWRMIELYHLQPGYFDFPDSKTFGLIIKCYSGSTYKYAAERMEKIHFYHDKLTSLYGCPLVKDDPHLLMHSIKSITKFTEDQTKLKEWLRQLYSFSMGKVRTTKVGYDEKIDLTGTYNSALRGLVKEGQIDLALKTLRNMQEICDSIDAENATDLENQINIELKTNAYNLILGSCRTQKDVIIAIELLNEMNIETSKRSIPLPDDQSFALVIKSLSVMTDMNAAQALADRFMTQYESRVRGKKIRPSVVVHNAYMNLIINRFGHRKDLVSKCDVLIDRMTKISNQIRPDSITWNLLLKACANDCFRDPHKQQEILLYAKTIFDQMRAGTKGELNDISFQHMMKCVSSIEDPEERTKEIKDLFSEASKHGFVSAKVLRLLKQNVSDKDFTSIVGNGRLADNWLANVTSTIVRYTDFTNGGANKHARRKGKSTSNWAKKQRKRIESTKERKSAKKLLSLNL